MIGVFTERFDSDNPAQLLAMGGVADLLTAGPAIIKIHHSPAQLKYVRKKDKTVLCMYRDIPTLEEPFYGNTPSAAFADVYWQAIKPHLAGLGFAVINVWPNEPSVDIESLKQLDEYYARLAVLARADGYTIAGYAFSAEGAAALADGRWQYIKKSLKALRDNGHYLDLHGYFSPSLKDPAGTHFLFPWRVLRQIIPANILPPIICGEFGIDTNLGMNRIYDGYRTVPGYGNATYADELLWANAELKKDNVPAVIYLATRANCPDDQINYNIMYDDSRKGSLDPAVWARIAPFISDTYIPSQPPVPVPEPEPTPDPVQLPPTGQTKRVFTVARLNVRGAPNTAGSVLRVLEVGEHVYITSNKSGDFIQLDAQLDLDHGSPKPATAWASGVYLAQ